jgi:hypothetical protein
MEFINMKSKKPLLVLLVVVIALLAIAIPLQYLVRRDVVVGLASNFSHSHAHGEEESDHEEEGQTEADILLGSNLISNFGFEVGTYEQIWGWANRGVDQGAILYVDKNVVHKGFASAAVDTNGKFAQDAGWFTKLYELPSNRDVVFEGYVKTQALQGEAYLRVFAEGLKEGQEETQLILSTSTDNVHGDSDWTYTSLRCFIPPEATSVWLEVGVFGVGKAWFDDVSLKAEEREDVLTAGVNLLKNPSLEDGARYWHYFSNSKDTVISYGNSSTGPDAGPAFFFQNSAPSPAEGGFSWFYQSITGLYGHKGTLTLSGWMRAEGLNGIGTIGVRVFRLAGETALRSVNEVSGDAPWTDFKIEIPIDGKAFDAWVVLDLEGSGRLYVSGLNATFLEEQAAGQ